jgi:hypothetical protein
MFILDLRKPMRVEPLVEIDGILTPRNSMINLGMVTY